MIDPWKELFFKVALAANCLPSNFVGQNDHVIKAIEAARTPSDRATALEESAAICQRLAVEALDSYTTEAGRTAAHAALICAMGEIRNLKAGSAGAGQSEPVNRIVARLKIEKLAALLTDTDRTKQDIVEADGETVSGVRIGWGAWALLRAKIIDVIETKCAADAFNSGAELTTQQIDAAMDVARFEYGHGVTRASIVAIHRALKSQQDAAIESQRSGDGS